MVWTVWLPCFRLYHLLVVQSWVAHHSEFVARQHALVVLALSRFQRVIVSSSGFMLGRLDSSGVKFEIHFGVTARSVILESVLASHIVLVVVPDGLTAAFEFVLRIDGLWDCTLAMSRS